MHEEIRKRKLLYQHACSGGGEIKKKEAVQRASARYHIVFIGRMICSQPHKSYIIMSKKVAACHVTGNEIKHIMVVEFTSMLCIWGGSSMAHLFMPNYVITFFVSSVINQIHAATQILLYQIRSIGFFFFKKKYRVLHDQHF